MIIWIRLGTNQHPNNPQKIDGILAVNIAGNKPKRLWYSIVLVAQLDEPYQTTIKKRTLAFKNKNG